VAAKTDGPVDLDYATRSTPAQPKLPPSKFNKLDWLQISIVIVVVLMLAAFVLRFLFLWTPMFM
jgi:hypothetical protein